MHARADKQACVSLLCGSEKPNNLFRRMLAVRVEENEEFNLGLGEPVMQTSFYRLALSAVLGMHDDLCAVAARPIGGGIGRTIVNHEDMVELSARSLDYFPNMDLLMIGGDDGRHFPAIERAAWLRRCALHR